MTSLGPNTKVQLIGSDGEPLGDGPIDITELLEREQRTMTFEDSRHRQVRLMLQEAEDDYADYDAATAQRFVQMDDDDTDDGADGDGGAAANGQYGFAEVNDWYQKIEQAQEELVVERLNQSNRGAVNVSISRDASPARPGGGGAAGLAGGASTMTRREKEKESERLERVKQEWTAAAPPPPVPARSFKAMKSVNPDIGATAQRKFVPLAISHHSVAAHRVGAGGGDRVVIFGGTNGFSTENELYEFSVTTATWRRLEGKLHVPIGCHSHAAATHHPSGRMFVTGGIGLGGTVAAQPAALDAAAQERFKMLFPRGLGRTSSSGGGGSSPHNQQQSIVVTRPALKGAADPTNASGLASRAAAATVQVARPELGILHFVYEFNFHTSQWHLVVPNYQHAVARHSTVCYGDHTFTFGGVTEALAVTNHLVSMDVSNFACRMLRKAGDGPVARYSHSAVVFGHWMIVFGGADANNEVLSDAWSFDFETGMWEAMACIGDVPARMGHSATVIGSRMLVVGGVSVSSGDESRPMDSIAELNLVPTAKGFIWRDIEVTPGIPKMVYGAALGCGDDATIVVFGGITEAAGKARVHSPHKSTLIDKTNVVDPHAKHGVRAASAGPAKAARGKSGAAASSSALRLAPTNACTLVTFPIAKAKKADHDADAEHDDHNNPDAPLDPKFIEFLKRQRKFVLEKESKEKKTQQQLSIKAEEDADTHLYLDEDEIDNLLRVADTAINTLRYYDFNQMPTNTPNRDVKLKHMEESHFYLGQCRDVLRSMVKKELTEEDLKKKKKTRRKEGEKFEDFSAAKPFRRALIFNLLSKTLSHQKALRKLNRSLAPFHWDGKEAYIRWTHDCHDALKGLTGRIKEILDKYINERVESLQKNAERHKINLESLRQIVEKQQRDKIWKKEGPDRHREARKKRLAQDEADAKAADKAAAAGLPPPKRKKSKSPWKKHPKPPPREPDVTIAITKDDVAALLKRALRAKEAAQIFTTHCGGGSLEQVYLATQQQQQAQQQQAQQPANPQGAQPLGAPPQDAAASAWQQQQQQQLGSAMLAGVPPPNYGFQQQMPPPGVPNAPPMGFAVPVPNGPADQVAPPPMSLEEKSRLAKNDAIGHCQRIFDGLCSFETAVTALKAADGGAKVHARSVKMLNDVRKMTVDVMKCAEKIRVANPNPNDLAGPTIIDAQSHALAEQVRVKVNGLFQRLSNAFLTRTPMPRGPGSHAKRSASNSSVSSASSSEAGSRRRSKTGERGRQSQPAVTVGKRRSSASAGGKPRPTSAPARRASGSPSAPSATTAATTGAAQLPPPPPPPHLSQSQQQQQQHPAARVVTPLTSHVPQYSIRPLTQQFTMVRPASASVSRVSADGPQPSDASLTAAQPPQRQPQEPQPQPQKLQQSAAGPVLAAQPSQVTHTQLAPQQMPPPALPQQPPLPLSVPPSAIPQQQQQYTQPLPAAQPGPANDAQAAAAAAAQYAQYAQYHAAQRIATPVVSGAFGGGVDPRFDEEYIQRMYGGASRRGEPREATVTASGGAFGSAPRNTAHDNGGGSKRAVAPAPVQFKGPLTPGERAILQSRQRNRQW